MNASYSVVSQIQNQQLSITKVTQRLFRGFKRDEIIYQHIRQDLLDKQDKILAVVQETEPLFENPREYQSALKYINGFFDIISDDKKYKREILDIARIK